MKKWKEKVKKWWNGKVSTGKESPKWLKRELLQHRVGLRSVDMFFDLHLLKCFNYAISTPVRWWLAVSWPAPAFNPRAFQQLRHEEKKMSSHRKSHDVDGNNFFFRWEWTKVTGSYTSTSITRKGYVRYAHSGGTCSEGKKNTHEKKMLGTDCPIRSKRSQCPPKKSLTLKVQMTMWLKNSHVTETWKSDIDKDKISKAETTVWDMPWNYYKIRFGQNSL